MTSSTLTKRLLLSLMVIFATYQNAMVALGQSATVDFESLPVGTSFGQAYGESPGDLIFSENGVGVIIDEFTGGFLPEIPKFTSVEIGGFTNPAFSTTPATINNVRLVFDLSELPGEVFSANFEFTDFGGDENLVINGEALQVRALHILPGSLAGVNISVNDLGSIQGAATRRGSIELTGPITSIAIGGQELGIDNVTFNYALIGDVNLDGTVDFSDIPPFISVLAGGGFQVQADCDLSGVVDFSDISPFIAILSDS